MNQTDNSWRHWGEADPYYGVLTDKKFKRGQMDDAAREEFFTSGKRYVEFVLGTVRDHLDPAFRPTRALDFGCGVGRLSIPLAGLCEAVVGMDISDGMLAEARQNAEKRGVQNVLFHQSDETLSALTGTFDLLNSLIVFQHIRPWRGELIFKRMLGLLRDGGVGALQFTYAYESETPAAKRALIRAYKAVPPLWSVRNVLKGRPIQEPMMQMNEYDLNHLFRILQEAGCHAIHPHFTETGSFGYKFFGVILFFQKRAVDTAAHA